MSLAGESIDSLARQIAELAQALGKLEHAWLARIREFDRREGWAQTGCISMSAWLAWHTGISHKAASERVRVARALGELPLIDHAFESGELSYSKVRAITRIAEPAQQQALIDVAKSATASQLDKIVGGLRRVRAAATPEENIIRKVPRRHVRFETTEDGMVRMVAVIGPEEALMVQAAMRLAESPTEASADSTGATDSPTPSREESPAGDWGESQADALVAVARGYVERKPTTRGSGFELIMITTPEQLEHGPDGVGGILRDGTPVPLGIARALACDAKRVDVSVGESGEILDVGRARRTIPSAIARALALRDGCCRVPGCGRSRHLEAHHVESWAAGGATKIDNLVLLCSAHHLALHEGRLRVAEREGTLEFRNAQGLTLTAAPHHDLDPSAIAAWIDGAEPAGDQARDQDGQRLDLHEVIDWMMLAQGFGRPQSSQSKSSSSLS